MYSYDWDAQTGGLLLNSSPLQFSKEPRPVYYKELDMGEDTSKKDGGKKARGEFWNGFKTILDTNDAFKEIGLGLPEIDAKENKNGEVKKSMISIMRTPWVNPEPLVILYSLYKFAEACGNYYQFIREQRVSPLRISGA